MTRIVLAILWLFGLVLTPANAADPIKIGMILTLSGGMGDGGREIIGGAKLYLSQIGGSVDGRKIELIVKDDQGRADAAKRIAQEMITQDHVSIITGLAITPLALAVGPLLTEAKIPGVILGAGTSIITEKSPYFVRPSFTLPQQTEPLADWVSKQGAKTAVTMVTDYGPGFDAEKTFTSAFERDGGKVLASLRVPYATADYSPYLQRAADAHPDVLFLFAPGVQGVPLIRQAAERGMLSGHMKIVGTGDLTDDQTLGPMPDSMIGLVTSHFYSAAHKSAVNEKFVKAFRTATGMRPNFLAVSGYDGMHLIVEAIRKTKGDLQGDKLVDAMRGQKWESPRGPIEIDPATRDIIQNVYIRKVERVNGRLYNIEFATIPQVKDPLHGKPAPQH